MKKWILFAVIFVSFAPVFATTYTIDASLLGNSTSYDAFPGEIYIFYWNTKSITLTANQLPLDLYHYLTPGDSYYNEELNLTIMASQCPNQTINITIPECPACNVTCDFSANITDQAKCLAQSYTIESQNQTIFGLHETIDKMNDRERNMTNALGVCENQKVIEFQRGKQVQTMESTNVFWGMFGPILFIIAAVSVFIAVIIGKGWWQPSIIVSKKTIIQKIESDKKVVTRQEKYKYPVLEVGMNRFQVGDETYPMSWIVAWDKSNPRINTVIIADPKIQEELGLPSKKAEEERDMFREQAEKEKKAKEKLRKKVDKAMDLPDEDEET